MYREGLNVITTIDPKLQKIAINELRSGLENYDKRHGWRGPLENLGNNDLESLRIKYKNFPGLHNKIAALILEIDKNEILVQSLQSKNKFKINIEKCF